MNKHKGLKVLWYGGAMKDIYPHATKWQVFLYHVRVFLLRVFIVVILCGSIYGAFIAGGIYNPAVIYTKAEVIKEVPVKAPILDRIAKCESPTGHYDKNGQISLNANTDRSVDIGKYQINNRAWGKKATELGYNLMVEKDNDAMAHWIYENRGTEDWYSSKACWMK